MAGFWETFSNSARQSLGDYEQLKEQKRLRALQKLKFITENSDVGSPVDPTAAQEIADYAPEGNAFIKDGAYTGNLEQQRQAEFRKYMTENPEADPETVMRQGVSAGAVSGNSYGNYLNSVEAREARRQDLLLRLQEQRARQEDAQQHTMALRGMTQAFMSRNDGANAPDESKAWRQKWATNRKTYAPHGGPYNYLTQVLLNDPEMARQELSTIEGMEPDFDMDSPDPWNKYAGYVATNADTFRDKYGMKPEEIQALLTHVRKIGAKRTR
jgi:hypothetical protein